ncbi:hypothetical protein, partial [Pseudomonas sp. FW305-33]
ARLFVVGDRPRFVPVAAIGFLLGLSGSFRIANVFLAAGYFLFFGLSFLIRRDQKTFWQGFAFGLAFVVGVLPVLAANLVNSG